MLKALITAAFAAGVLGLTAASASAQTIRVMVVAQDAEKDSLNRHSRVQRDVANAFNQALNAPNGSDIYRKYGIQGMDVYDERALVQSSVPLSEEGRTDDELIALARSIHNPRLDLLLAYTIFAEAVPDPYIKGLARLHMSVRYRALDVRSGRFLGGDNLDLARDGVPMTGCAAGVGIKDANGNLPQVHPICVYDFVAEQAEKLVRDAASTISIQIAALVQGSGGTGQQGDLGGDMKGNAGVTPAVTGGDGECRHQPTEYAISFRGLTKGQMGTLIDRMNAWPCGMNIGLIESTLSEASYTYKVRANEAVLKLKIEGTMEALGLQGGVVTRGANELVVTTIPIRTN